MRKVAELDDSNNAAEHKDLDHAPRQQVLTNTKQRALQQRGASSAQEQGAKTNQFDRGQEYRHQQNNDRDKCHTVRVERMRCTNQCGCGGRSVGFYGNDGKYIAEHKTDRCGNDKGKCLLRRPVGSAMNDCAAAPALQ